MKVQLSPCLRCARLWLLLPVLKYSLEGQCGAGGSTYVAAHERYPNPAALPDRNTHGARCRSCHLCGSSGLVYSLSHQAHEREAAAGTGCIYLCLHHAVLGTAPAARQAVGTASSSLLQSGFPLQAVAQREGFFPDRNPSFQPYVAKQAEQPRCSTPGWCFSPVVHAVCFNSSEVLLSEGLPGAVVSMLPLPVITQSALAALH